MKKLLIALLALVIVFSLAACGGGSSNDDAVVDMKTLAGNIADAGLFVDSLESVSEKVVSNVVGLDISSCESVEYHMGSGATGEEYGLFVCADAAAAKALAKQLETRKTDLYSTYESYNAEALPRIENAVIRQAGKYVVFISADNYEKAAAIADEAFN